MPAQSKSNTPPRGKSIAEFRMRKLLRELYPDHKPKLNWRPPWLSGCELDVAYLGLNLAFEFNGKQHYEFDPHYHKTLADLDAQIERDRFKAEKCRQSGLRLIVVRYGHLESADVIRRLIAGEDVDPLAKWRGNPQSEHRMRKARKKRSHEKRLAAWKATKAKA